MINIYEFILNNIGQLIIAVIILIVIIIFGRPILNLLEKIDAKKIKIADYEWEYYKLEQVVLEREKLKNAIIIAAADKKFLDSELRHISKMAFEMKSHCL